MDNEILITVGPGETRVALLHSGVVQELHIERSQNNTLVGNIYMGKVVRILPGLQSAFINIGLERNGFLHFSDIIKQPSSRGKSDSIGTTDIRHVLHEGQIIMVQITKNLSLIHI